MIRFLMREITRNPLVIDYLEVQSFEMNVYLVYITSGGQSGMVYDDEQDRPKRFFSAGQIREAFSHCHVEKAVMKHDSPYDEMIGNPPKSAEQMALPFSMVLPY